MPRSTRKPRSGPEADALDTVAAAYERTEKLLGTQHEALLNAMVNAHLAGMPKAEAARRAGYSREHGSRLIDELLRTRAAED